MKTNESIIEFLSCLISLRLPIQLLFLSQLALPNGRAGEEKESWRAWPPQGNSPARELLFLRRQLMNEFELFFSFVVGYERSSAIMLRKKRENKNNSNEMKSIAERAAQSLSFLLANSTILSFVAVAGEANKRIELVGVGWVRERGQMSLWFGGLRAAASRRQPAKGKDELAPKSVLFFFINSIYLFYSINSIHSIPFSFSRWGCGEEKRNWWNWAAGSGSVAKPIHYFYSVCLDSFSLRSHLIPFHQLNVLLHSHSTNTFNMISFQCLQFKDYYNSNYMTIIYKYKFML